MVTAVAWYVTLLSGALLIYGCYQTVNNNTILFGKYFDKIFPSHQIRGEKIPALGGHKGIKMDAVLEWAEKAGLENLRFRLQNAETLAKEAATTLTVLLAGMAGSLTYAIKYADAGASSMPLAVGAGALSAWLMALSALLVHFCIKTLPLQPPTNEPGNLYQPAFDIAVLRQVELKNLQSRIDQATARNTMVAIWLDRIRYLAVSSPLLFVISVFAASGLAPDLVAQALVAG